MALGVEFSVTRIARPIACERDGPAWTLLERQAAATPAGMVVVHAGRSASENMPNSYARQADVYKNGQKLYMARARLTKVAISIFVQRSSCWMRARGAVPAYRPLYRRVVMLKQKENAMFLSACGGYGADSFLFEAIEKEGSLFLSRSDAGRRGSALRSESAP